jgi:hypothetical protein
VNGQQQFAKAMNPLFKMNESIQNKTKSLLTEKDVMK